MVAMNLSLGVFNLLPVPPFDGSRIALLFLPQRLYFKAMKYERYIMLTVLALVIFGPVGYTAVVACKRHVAADAAADRLCGIVVGVLIFCRKF